MNMKHLLNPFLLAAALVFPIPLASAADGDAVPSRADDEGSFSGKVAETMTTAGYTYVLVDTGSRKLWAAATQFAVKVGDTVAVAGGIPMSNFHSRTLNRDFDLVYFSGDISVVGGGSKPSLALPPGHPALPGMAAPALPPNHPPLTGQPAGAKLDFTGIKRAADGKNIQEIFAAQSTLAGKPVTVRGRVVQYNPMIMGKNWLHIQDGSGGAENKDNDLTVTTATPARLGDTVLVTGILSTNKDFGAGYKYAVILEDAKVTVE